MDAGPASSSNAEGPRQRVSSGSKVHDHVARALAQLQSASVLTIIAEGKAVYKAITIAEITKRRRHGLHQNTQIGVTHEKRSDLDERASVPKINITLSTIPLDEDQPGYQPPIGAAGLNDAWIDEAEIDMADMDEGGGDRAMPKKRRKRERDAARWQRRSEQRAVQAE